MLLAGLQREAHRGHPRRVHADADQAPRHCPAERVARGEEGRVRAAEAHRHAEALRGADHNVGPHLAGGREQREAQQIGGHDRQRAGLVRRRDLGVQVAHRARGAGILQHHGEGTAGEQRDRVAGREIDQFVAERPSPGRQHRAGLRMQVGGHRDHAARRLGQSAGHRHGLGHSRRLIEQRGVGDRHGGELAHHGLEVEQRLQPPLRDLGLVGRVGGVPAGVLQHVAQDHRRGVGAVVALADQRFLDHVASGERAQLGDRPGLVDRRGKVHHLLRADRAGNGLVGQFTQARDTQHGKHSGDLALTRGHVAAHEGVVRFERGQFGQRFHHVPSAMKLS